jgi:O-antigen ligase
MMHVIPSAEILSGLLGVNLRPAAILGAIIILGVLFSGQMYRFWLLSVAKPWIVLMVLFFLASLFSDYPGRSVPFMAQYGIRFHIFPFLICAVAQSGAQVRYMMRWAAVGGFVVLLVTLVYGTMSDGRLVIPGGSLSNPNDLALCLILVLVYMVSMFSGSAWMKLAAAVGIALAVFFVLRTGSRANFLTLVLLAGSFFFLGSGKVKSVLMLVLPILAVASIFALPASTLRRLTMIVSNPEEVYNTNDETRSAVGSQLAREELQRRAFELAKRRPLLGAGPLMFTDAVEVMVRSEAGVKSGWQNAHNVYLQLAAENGIPALLIFVGIMIWTVKTNFRAYRNVRRDPRLKSYEVQSMCLLQLTVAYAFGIAFGNYIYDGSFPVLLGLTAANTMAIQKDTYSMATPAPSPALAAV